MAYFPIIPAACMSLIFSKIAFTVFALCQIVNHFGPPAKFYGPAATRWSDPAGRRLGLDHRKRSDVLRLRVEGSVAEKPTPMSHGGDGGIQPDSALPLGDQETQEHAKCLGTIFDCSPPAGATLRENKSAQPRASKRLDFSPNRWSNSRM